MSQLLTRSGLAQPSPQAAPVSLGQFGLPNILELLLRSQQQPGRIPPPSENVSDRQPEDGIDLFGDDRLGLGRNLFGGLGRGKGNDLFDFLIR